MGPMLSSHSYNPYLTSGPRQIDTYTLWDSLCVPLLNLKASQQRTLTTVDRRQALTFHPKLGGWEWSCSNRTEGGISAPVTHVEDVGYPITFYNLDPMGNALGGHQLKQLDIW